MLHDIILLFIGAYFGIGLFLLAISVTDKLIPPDVVGKIQAILLIFVWPVGFFLK